MEVSKIIRNSIEYKKCIFNGHEWEVPGVPANDEIWYTSSDGNIVTPNNPSSLPEIDTNTYSDGKGVIKFKTNVTSIGINTFENCFGLTSITIPNSVTSIGQRAFYFCGLASVMIPNSVVSIGSSAFEGCGSLTSINVASDNSNYCSVDGVLFNKDKTTLIQYPGGKQGAYTIPNSVTSIGSSAFYFCTSLVSVMIPNSVTSIGASAFKSCSSLTSVTIPNSVTSIGASAFENCRRLPVVNYLRYADTYLVEATNKKRSSYAIRNGTKWIGSYAFTGCTGLTSVTIPNSVTSIGESAFYKCTGLTAITIPNSVTSIGMSAFSGCTGLTSVTIPDSVTSIGGNAFKGSSLKSVTIPNSVTSIEPYTFQNCTGLTSVTIGNSVTSIGNYAFSGCSGLTSVTIPNSVTSIGNNAFENCSGLTSITCEALTPPTCGSDAFYNTNNCPIYVPLGSVEAYKAATNWSKYASRIYAISE